MLNQINILLASLVTMSSLIAGINSLLGNKKSYRDQISYSSFRTDAKIIRWMLIIFYIIIIFTFRKQIIRYSLFLVAGIFLFMLALLIINRKWSKKN